MPLYVSEAAPDILISQRTDASETMAQTTLTPIESGLARLLNKRLRSVILPTDLTPVQITVVYAVLGFGALYFSDVFLPQLIRDAGVLARLQALKGGVEVVLTAGVIFVLTTRSRRALEQRYDRLDTLRAERNVLHRVFRHNLRQDINIIMGYSEIIREKSADADLHDKCEKVLDSVAEIQRYQQKIIEIEHILEPPIRIERMDLSDVVRADSLLQSLQRSDAVSISLDIPEEAPVIVSPYIKTAFREVLENAIEHNTADNPSIRVSIQENSEELVDLIVEDNGPGISEYERLAVEGMEEADLTHSSGLGLWMAKLACVVSGGDLDLPAQFDGGGKAVLELPEAPEQTIRRRLPVLSG